MSRQHRERFIRARSIRQRPGRCDGLFGGQSRVEQFYQDACQGTCAECDGKPVLPGFTATTYLERASAEQVDAWREISPIKRFIDPNEIADVTISVAENKAMTGSLIVIDGGFSLRLG